MIIIERKYYECFYSSGTGEQANPRCDRKAFADDDIVGVNDFIHENCSDAHNWKQLSFTYIKL